MNEGHSELKRLSEMVAGHQEMFVRINQTLENLQLLFHQQFDSPNRTPRQDGMNSGIWITRISFGFEPSVGETQFSAIFGRQRHGVAV